MPKKKKAPPERHIDIPWGAPALTTLTGEVVVPVVGEVFKPVDVDHVTLGEALRFIRENEDQLKAAKKIIVGEVLARMDHKATWTLQFGPGKLTAPSPRRDPLYVGDRLHANLKQLVADDVIDEDALTAACKKEVEYKPMKGGIKKLKALGEERIDQALELAAEPDERPRSVRVELDPNHHQVR